MRTRRKKALAEGRNWTSDWQREKSLLAWIQRRLDVGDSVEQICGALVKAINAPEAVTDHAEPKAFGLVG